MKTVCTENMTRDEWIKFRKNYIGGSDAAAIIGLNPFVTPYSLWAEKTGRLPEREDNEAMRQGRDLEQYVADLASRKKQGLKLQSLMKCTLAMIIPLRWQT